MRTSCQEYRDGTIEDALKSGCDTVQLKYDGWWSRTHLANLNAKTWSKTDRLVNEFPYDHPEESLLIGEYLWGTQWAQNPSRRGRYVMFDCWYISGQDLTAASYRDRYALMRGLFHANRTPQRFDIIQNYPISAFDSLWQIHIDRGDFEGVVFRRSADPVNVRLWRQKALITVSLKVTGYVEGEGKHLGRLGALIAETSDGIRVDVGGGFSDADRDLIWVRQGHYLNKWFDVEARKEFKSGSLRHPNFVCWRDDL